MREGKEPQHRRVLYWDDIHYAAILKWDDADEGRDRQTYWVNWELYASSEVRKQDGTTERWWTIGGASPKLGTIEQAEYMAEGFCKWDACFQGHMDVHFDGRPDLEDMAEALQRLYDEIAKLTGDDYIGERTQQVPPLDSVT